MGPCSNQGSHATVDGAPGLRRLSTRRRWVSFVLREEAGRAQNAANSLRVNRNPIAYAIHANSHDERKTSDDGTKKSFQNSALAAVCADRPLDVGPINASPAKTDSKQTNEMRKRNEFGSAVCRRNPRTLGKAGRPTK